MADTTAFDLLYDEYFPFRLYADYMLGRTTSELAADFGISENWISERVEAVRLCVEKQVRLDLVTPVQVTRPYIPSAMGSSQTGQRA